ncbi:hypothetical protein BN1013_02007 [Candidatus Rubidus massiliensis]|nr:hypothetical protein BN1013_02007 [Candidatus Rubidus massiliensis]
MQIQTLNYTIQSKIDLSAVKLFEQPLKFIEYIAKNCMEQYMQLALNTFFKEHKSANYYELLTSCTNNAFTVVSILVPKDVCQKILYIFTKQFPIRVKSTSKEIAFTVPTLLSQIGINTYLSKSEWEEEICLNPPHELVEAVDRWEKKLASDVKKFFHSLPSDFYNFNQISIDALKKIMQVNQFLVSSKNSYLYLIGIQDEKVEDDACTFFHAFVIEQRVNRKSVEMVIYQSWSEDSTLHYSLQNKKKIISLEDCMTFLDRIKTLLHIDNLKSNEPITIKDVFEFEEEGTLFYPHFSGKQLKGSTFKYVTQAFNPSQVVHNVEEIIRENDELKEHFMNGKKIFNAV